MHSRSAVMHDCTCMCNVPTAQLWDGLSCLIGVCKCIYPFGQIILEYNNVYSFPFSVRGNCNKFTPNWWNGPLKMNIEPNLHGTPGPIILGGWTLCWCISTVFVVPYHAFPQSNVSGSDLRQSATKCSISDSSDGFTRWDSFCNAFSFSSLIYQPDSFSLMLNFR